METTIMGYKGLSRGIYGVTDRRIRAGLPLPAGTADH